MKMSGIFRLEPNYSGNMTTKQKVSKAKTALPRVLTAGK